MLPLPPGLLVLWRSETSFCDQMGGKNRPLFSPGRGELWPWGPLAPTPAVVPLGVVVVLLGVERALAAEVEEVSTGVLS